jgi:hypothetical protein
MLDLRVVLATCLAAFVFLLAGIGVFATLRVGHQASVETVKDGGLPPEQVRKREVKRNPLMPVETPARASEAPRTPEVTGSIERLLKSPPPPPAPQAIEDILNGVPPPPAPRAAVTRVEPVETPVVKETAATPVHPVKSAAKRRHAAKTRSRVAHRIQYAPATTAPPFFLFDPQLIGTAANPVR